MFNIRIFTVLFTALSLLQFSAVAHADNPERTIEVTYTHDGEPKKGEVVIEFGRFKVDGEKQDNVYRVKANPYGVLDHAVAFIPQSEFPRQGAEESDEDYNRRLGAIIASRIYTTKQFRNRRKSAREKISGILYQLERGDGYSADAQAVVGTFVRKTGEAPLMKATADRKADLKPLKKEQEERRENNEEVAQEERQLEIDRVEEDIRSLEAKQEAADREFEMFECDKNPDNIHCQELVRLKALRSEHLTDKRTQLQALNSSETIIKDDGFDQEIADRESRIARLEDRVAMLRREQEQRLAANSLEVDDRTGEVKHKRGKDETVHCCPSAAIDAVDPTYCYSAPEQQGEKIEIMSKLRSTSTSVSVGFDDVCSEAEAGSSLCVAKNAMCMKILPNMIFEFQGDAYGTVPAGMACNTQHAASQLAQQFIGIQVEDTRSNYGISNVLSRRGFAVTDSYRPGELPERALSSPTESEAVTGPDGRPFYPTP